MFPPLLRGGRYFLTREKQMISTNFMSRETILHLLRLLLIFTLGLLIYSNSFDASFHLDDSRYVIRDDVSRGVLNLEAIWQKSPPRFISYVTLAFNYHFSKLNVFDYHLVAVSIKTNKLGQELKVVSGELERNFQVGFSDNDLRVD